MRILYEKTLDGVCLQRCYGLDKILEIPGTVVRVVKLFPTGGEPPIYPVGATKYEPRRTCAATCNECARQMYYD